MKYMVKDEEGNVYGPVSQAELEDWAKEERLFPETEVRNVMFKHWRTAEEYAFLAPYLKPWADKEVMTRPDPIKIRSGNTSIKSLTTSFIFRFTPAGLFHRTTAYLIDLAIISTIWAIISGATVISLAEKHIFTELFTTANIGMFVFIYLLYFTVMIGMKAQTVGHWFWGIMVVNANDGSPVYTGTAFTYSLLLMLFWWLAPYGIYITPAKRTLHEYLTHCRIIYTRRKIRNSK